MNHRQLCENLSYTKETIYVEVPLASVFLNHNFMRADVVDIKPSYTRFCLSIYEVKENRSDFLSDIRAGKWKGYLPFCHRFYFATKKSVCKKDEIPDGVGLIQIGDKGWYSVKSAKCRDIDYTPETFQMLQSLLFYRQKSQFANRNNVGSYYKGMRNLMYYDTELKYLGRNVSKIIQENRDLKRKLAKEQANE